MSAEAGQALALGCWALGTTPFKACAPPPAPDVWLLSVRLGPPPSVHCLFGDGKLAGGDRFVDFLLHQKVSEGQYKPFPE